MFQRLLRTPVTALLLAVIVVTFLIESLRSGSLLDTNGLVLLQMGANQPQLVWQGQWWRLVASMFLHIGLVHLLFNGWALYQLGALTELLLGPGRMLGTYFLTGIVGSFVSVLWLGRGGLDHVAGLSAGASGAIFGLLGALITFLLRRRDRLLPGAKALLSQLVFWAGINLVLGVTLDGIDNSAHLGGLISGLLAGLVLSERRPRPLPYPTSLIP